MLNNYKFVHTRSRSSYSLAEGAIKIDDLVQLAIDNNMPALALTDNGNLFGALEFSMKAARNGIQPLLGVIIELKIENDMKILSHLDKKISNTINLPIGEDLDFIKRSNNYAKIKIDSDAICNDSNRM